MYLKLSRDLDMNNNCAINLIESLLVEKTEDFDYVISFIKFTTDSSFLSLDHSTGI